MFTNCLEVEENLKMSKNLLDRDNSGETKDTLKLVGPYKQNGKVSDSSKLSPDMQKDDRPDAGAGSPAGLFSENGNLYHPWSVKDDFKKEFGMPVYDEYEEEYLQNIPENPAVETNHVDERHQDAM